MKLSFASLAPALPALGAFVGSASLAAASSNAAIAIPAVLTSVAALGAGATSVWQAYRIEDARTQCVSLASQVAELEAFQTTTPDAWIAVSANGQTAVSPKCAALFDGTSIQGIDAIALVLTEPDGADLLTRFRSLQVDGESFEVSVKTSDKKRILRATGTQAKAGGNSAVHILWLRDETELTQERKRTADDKAKLDQKITELRSALNALPVPLWLRNEKLDIVWCNAAYAAALDTTPEAAVKEQRELFSGASGAEKRGLAQRARNSGAAASEAGRIVVNGARRSIEVTETLLPSRGMVLGFALDKTDEGEVRSELQRHMAAQSDLLEQLGSAIAIYGPDTRLKFYNHAYSRLWGLDEAWLNTNPPYAEVLEDLRARRRLPEVVDFLRFKKDSLAQFTSLIESQESLMHLPDGTTLRMIAVPHALGGLMFILEDVTSALALETSYNTLMAVQQETLDNLAEGIAVFGSDGRLKLSNPSYSRIWKLSPEDLHGEPHLVEILEKVKALLLHDDWSAFREDFIANTLERSSRSGRLERADGSIVAFSTVPLPDGAVLMSFLDVTDTARVEQALRASNAALETADRLKSEFIANVSYQLRTPLNAIMGFAEILTNQYFGPLNPRQLEYSRSVLDASQRLLALINDILDLATIEAGYMELEVGPVDVAAMLENVVGLTREWGRKQNLEIEVDSPADVGTIQADEKRLKQAVFNLISNAIKFTPPGGRITIQTRRTDSSLLLTVSDTGIGIPDADQQRVFGKFERTNLQTRQTGAGLGLSLVKSFVELHNGTVEIDSRANEGTTVTCVLPADAPVVENKRLARQA